MRYLVTIETKWRRAYLKPDKKVAGKFKAIPIAEKNRAWLVAGEVTPNQIRKMFNYPEDRIMVYPEGPPNDSNFLTDIAGTGYLTIEGIVE